MMQYRMLCNETLAEPNAMSCQRFKEKDVILLVKAGTRTSSFSVDRFPAEAASQSSSSLPVRPKVEQLSMNTLMPLLLCRPCQTCQTLNPSQAWWTCSLLRTRCRNPTEPETVGVNLSGLKTIELTVLQTAPEKAQKKVTWTNPTTARRSACRLETCSAG